MASQSLPNSSLDRPFFFDDDDLRITFYFKAPNDNHLKDLSTPALIKTNLQISSLPIQFNQKGLYALHNHHLAFFNSPNASKPENVINLAHARLTPLPKDNGNHGFYLAKNGVTYQVVCADQDTADNWLKVLKNVCVLTNFHEEYKAQKMIGKGSFAKVYLVEAKSSGKNFAVKAFCKEAVFASNKNNSKPSMINEINIMRVLDHDNIIKLYEVYETDKSIYLVLELIQGKSLQEVLKKGGFKDNDARTINAIHSIIDALAYMQSKGIMHRDLKPDNILLDKGDKVKIVDFGLATFVDVPEYIFKKCGTPGYIAPEVFKYDQKNTSTFYDGRADVFSAGSILYYMLFGRPFFDCSNASEILKANRKFTASYESMNTIKQEVDHPHSKISKSGLNFCVELLEFDQHKRPLAVHCLNHPYINEVTEQKLAGSYNYYQNIGYSPSIHERRGSVLSEQSPHRRASVNGPIPAHRFAEKDSLMLDLGRPELTGRVDTINNSSNNNSLLLQKNDSLNSPKSGSPSPYGRNSVQLSGFSKNYGQGSNFMKAAIHKNMQNNHDEESKDSGIIMKRLQEVKTERRHSDFGVSGGASFNKPLTDRQSKYAGYQFDEDDTDDISQENPQIQKNVEKINLGMQNKFPSMMQGSPVRFASGSMSHRGGEKGV